MVVFALYMYALLALGGAHIYERCELARELSSLGVDKDHLATWVCIAFHESRFDTAARNPHSGDHGLLQISELYWCGPGKVCGIPCSALRDEDISDDVQCAHRIYKEHTRLQGDGFLAWVVYQHHCKNNAKKYLVDCESHLKNVTVKSDNRGRSLRTGRFKDTTARPFYSNYPDIDRLQPPFLAINLFLDGRFGKQLNDYYDNDNQRTNWLNYKIDNIDSLKLPQVSENGIQYTTPTTTTTTSRPTTTTIDPDLIGIRPPMPRRIETNQFRRKMNVNGLNRNQIKTGDNNKVINVMPQNFINQNYDYLSTTPKIFIETQREITTFNPITKQPPVITENDSTTAQPFFFTSGEQNSSKSKVTFENKFWETTTFLTASTPSSFNALSNSNKNDFAFVNVQPIEKSISSDRQTSKVKSESVASSNMSTTNFDRRYRPFIHKNSYDWTMSTLSTRKLSETTISPIITTNSIDNLYFTPNSTVNNYVKTYSSSTQKVDRKSQQVTTDHNISSESPARNYYYTAARPLLKQTNLTTNSSNIQTSLIPSKIQSYYFTTEKPIIISTTINIPTTTTATKMQSTSTNTVERNYYFTTPRPFATSNWHNVPTSTTGTQTQSSIAYTPRNYYFATAKPFSSKYIYNVPTSTVTTDPRNVFSNNAGRSWNKENYFTTPNPFSVAITTNSFQSNLTKQINKVSQSESGQNVKRNNLNVLLTNISNVESNQSLLSTFTNKSNVYLNDVYTYRPEVVTINVWSNANATTTKPQSSTWSWRRLPSSTLLPASAPASTTTTTTSHSQSRTAGKAEPVLSVSPKTIEQTKPPETTTKKPFNLFDLYLRPQKVEFVPFQFTVFKNSPKTLIFSGGTTVPPYK